MDRRKENLCKEKTYCAEKKQEENIGYLKLP